MPLSSRRNDTQSDTASIGGNSLATNSSSNSSTTTASTSTSRRSKCQPAKHGSFPSATASSLARGGPDTKCPAARSASAGRTALPKFSHASMAKNAKKRREAGQQKENIRPLKVRKAGMNIMDNKGSESEFATRCVEQKGLIDGYVKRISELECERKEHKMELQMVLTEGAYIKKLWDGMNDAVQAELESTQTKLTETIQSEEELKALTTELSSQLQTLTNHLESAQATIAALESKLRAKDEYCEQFSSIL